MWTKLIKYTGYEAHPDGSIRNAKTKRILRGQLNENGYLRIEVYFNGSKFRFFIHRMIAKLFIENPENKLEVNHKNGIRTDNRKENLEWNTRSEQMIHSYRVLKRNHARPNVGLFGSKHWNSRAVLQKTREGIIIKEWDSTASAGRGLNISARSVCKCCLGIMPTYMNYKWEYKTAI